VGSSTLETVMFTDVRSSTELRTTVGDEAAHRRLRAVHEAVSTAVTDASGTIVKALGDGVLATFTSPRQALHCAAAIQRGVGALTSGGDSDPLKVRIGINTGEVSREDGDIFGEAVNAASRIAGLADGGEIFVARVVKDLAGTVRDLKFVDRGMQTLKGFPEEWHIYEARIDARTPPISDKTPFVGRGAELSQLEGYLTNATRGRGSIAMIGGEPGVGKTRLAQELADEARREGAVVFIGACYEVETATPFAPFVEILGATARTVPKEVFKEIVGDSGPELARFYPELRVMFPDIPAPIELPAEQERRYTFNSIGRYVTRAATVRPLMLILDDLHWADEATLQLLQYIATLIDDLAALIVGTYRDVELAVGRPLARTLEQLVRQRKAHRISLKRLSQHDVSTMLERLAGAEPPGRLVEVIYSETDGNAFFVEEVFRHLLEERRLLDPAGGWVDDVSIDDVDVPESVRLVTGRRIERLEEETKRSLTNAAVIGRVFDVSLLEQVVGIDVGDLLDALDEAEHARLIEPLRESRDARYQFVHELVRQTLLAEISLPRRQRLHLAVAGAIESQMEGRAEDRVADLAHHLFQAGAAADKEMTLKYLTAAGDRSHATGGSEEAVRTYERALSLTEGDNAERAGLLYKLARSLRGLQRWDDAMAAWNEALEIFEQIGDSDGVARVCLAVADRYTWIGGWQEAVDILERGLSAHTEDNRSRGSLLAVQGVAYSWLGEHAVARDRIDRAERLGTEIDDARLYWTARSSRCIHHWCLNEHAEAVEIGLEAADVLRDAKALWGLATVLSFVQFSMTVSGRWEEAQRINLELTSVAESVGHPAASLFATRHREALIFLRNPDLDRSGAAAERDRIYCEAYDMPWVAESYSLLGNVMSMRGDWDEALELYRQGHEKAAPGAFHGASRGMLSMHLAYMGEGDACRARADELIAQESDAAITLGKATEAFFVVEGLVVLGDGERLAKLHDRIDFIARQMRWRAFDLQPADACLGACAAARGDLEAADRLFSDALNDAHAKGNHFADVDVKLIWGQSLLKSGENERARELLEEASQKANSFGLVGPARPIQRVLETIAETDEVDEAGA
jgi:class 3 adenylate cyclase/tetratricopeptide (TPR) repeat protein